MVELDVGVVGCDAACNLSFPQIQCERDVAVADEHDRRRRQLERRARRLLREDVLPDVITSARMEELNVVALGDGLETPQERL